MPVLPPLLVIIAGPPAAGKTTLARVLSSRYSLPLFTKDTFKEMMFDNSPVTTLAESRLYGKCSINSLQIVTCELLAHGISHIIEANFESALFSPFVRGLAAAFPFRCLQVQITCAPDVLEQRFFERLNSADRHPGHDVPGVDTMAVMRPSLATGRSTPLDIDGELVVFDTSAPVPYTPVFDAVEHLLASVHP